jgi:branched-chain amino acid transport system substrate-binding protein
MTGFAGQRARSGPGREARGAVGVPSRRRLLGGAVAGGALALLAPRRLAAAAPKAIQLGTIVPLSESGGPHGSDIAAAQQAVLAEINEAGGLLGRRVELVVEDDISNIDATVRAARKLIAVDKVESVMGIWASADAMAIAPYCWQAKVMMLCLAAADSITQLPHQGYVARTQPSTGLQGLQFGILAVGEGVRHLFILMPRTAFAEATIKEIAAYCAGKGVKVSSLIYDAKKTEFRAELDEVARAGPDMLMLGGYLPDTVLLARDAYRAEYKGKIAGFAYAIGPRFVERAGPVVADGAYAIEPVPATGSSAYARLRRLTGNSDIDTYTCQGYDQINLALLAMACGKNPTGTGIRDNLRKIGDKAGVVVDNALDGLTALAQGKAIDYQGASGPCKFAGNGDLAAANFRVSRVRGGVIETYKML